MVALPNRAYHIVLLTQVLLLGGAGRVGCPHELRFVVLLHRRLLGLRVRSWHRLNRKARLELIRLRSVHLVALTARRLAVLLRAVPLGVLRSGQQVLIHLGMPQVLHLIQIKSILVLIALHLSLRLRPIESCLARNARAINIFA